MFGDSAVRPRTTPISSAMPAKRWFAISSVTGSIPLSRLEQEAAEAVDREPPSGRDQRRGAVLVHDGGTPEPRAGREAVAAIDRPRPGAASEHHRSWPDPPTVAIPPRPIGRP